jgi:hypothetical protein
MVTVQSADRSEQAKGSEGTAPAPAAMPGPTTLEQPPSRMALGSAYRAYLESRKTLALAFKDREMQDVEAYKDTERRYHQCKEACDLAVRNREKAELEAAEVFRMEVDKAIERANQVYRDRTRLALSECKQKVMDAWKDSAESGTDTMVVCEEAVEKAMKAREKTEMDALDAYRQDVDRAIERSSRYYGDSISRAMTECGQRVLDAWDQSMQNSASVAGVFDQDKAFDPRPTREGRDWTGQASNKMAGSYRRVLAAVRSMVRRLKVKLSELQPGPRNDLVRKIEVS